MTCPNCNYARQPKDSIVPEWQCPSCGVAYAKFKAAIDRKVQVRLTSGQEIQFNKIKLYDLELVRQLDHLRRLAAKNFSGYSTGLSFWGDVEWVAAGSLLTSVLESAVSTQMAKDGARQLQGVGILAKQIRETAAFVHVSAIENIRYPDVGLWRCPASDKSRRREMIHIASEYVMVEIEGKETSIFWNKVERYSLVESA